MTGSQPQYKVSRVVAEFGLTDIEEELVARRTSEENPLSLRDLAAFFNRRVLRAAMEKAKMDPLEGEVENTYRLLTKDDVSSGVRTETKKKLQRNGIDVDRLTSKYDPRYGGGIRRRAMPDLVNVPTGCSFHPRCPYAEAACTRKEPQPVDPDTGMDATGTDADRAAACLEYTGDLAGGLDYTVEIQGEDPRLQPGDHRE